MRRVCHVWKLLILWATLFVLAEGVAFADVHTPSAPAEVPGEVRVHDKTVFVVRTSRGGRSATDRARAANLAIDALLAHPEEIDETRVEEAQGTAVIYVGKTPVITFGPEDVEATGEASLSVLGAHVSTRLGAAISTERQRSAIAKTVFSFSVLVFSGLIAFLLLRRVSDIAHRMRASLSKNPERITALHLGKIEFMSAVAARNALSIALILGRRLLQIAIGYGWLIIALSLFESTQDYTTWLAGMLAKPLYGIAERVGGALPIVVVLLMAAFAISVLVRFVGLFFDSVARGETHIDWLSRDLAAPTSALMRFGIIVVSLVLASPIITGESDGALSRAGLVALFAVALSSTPLVATAAIGIVVVFGRRLKKGDLVEVGGRSGHITDLTLLHIRIEDEERAEIDVPHLFSLWHPVRVHKHAPLTTLDVVIDGRAAQNEVERALLEAAQRTSARGHVELVYLDEAGAHWRIKSAPLRDDVSLAKAVQDSLAKIGVRLGRSHASPASAVRNVAGA
ncbi:MAG: mechanosensitive ion channel family protein [Polyangiaceae bacterium]|nr:mechanosensitive ion channel family protein [Polyangiaceae bacterium]